MLLLRLARHGAARRFAWANRRAECAAAAGHAPEAPPPRPSSEIPGPRNWPLLGTLPDFALRAKFDFSNLDLGEVHKSYNSEFGDVYRLNMPPFGEHLIVSDPREYAKIFQNEGQHPSGGAQFAWPLIRYYKDRGLDTNQSFMMDGERWKRIRTLTQKDLFGPKAAEDYLPAICEAARSASRCVGDHARGFDTFIARAAFDMICMVLIGRSMRATDKSAVGPADLEFVERATDAFTLLGQLMLQPHKQAFAGGVLRDFYAHMDYCFESSHALVSELFERISCGSESEFEGSCYTSKLKARGELSLEEIRSVIMVMIIGGVDTTHYVTCWLLLNLAQHPDKQETLRQELHKVLSGGDLTSEALKRMPYLKACMRESHRFTPSGPFNAMKLMPQDDIMCGFQVPKGTQVFLSVHPYMQRGDIVGDTGFRPERWLSAEVAERKSCPHASAMDHRLLKDPFGAGARMCMGARVATLEMQALTCRLLQDYRIELEPGQSWKPKQGLMMKADPFPVFKFTPL